MPRPGPARSLLNVRIHEAGIAAIRDAAAAAGVPVSTWHRAALYAALAKPASVRAYLPKADTPPDAPS